MTPICLQLAAMKDTLSKLPTYIRDGARWVDYRGNSVTEYCQRHSIDVADCVQRMRDRVREEMNLTVSAGIAPNMVTMVAQG